jgi:hypothetical protein
MLDHPLIDDRPGNHRYGYEELEEQEKLPEDDQRSTLRALLRDADEVKRMTLDELRARITAILPGATFEVDDLGQIVIRSSFRLRTEPEALEGLREKARRDYVPPKRGLFRKGR